MTTREVAYGFDPDVVRTRLFEKLIELEPRTTEQHPQFNANANWEGGLFASLVHDESHRVISTAPQCSNSPCKIVGVSLAIRELHTFFSRREILLEELLLDVSEVSRIMDQLPEKFIERFEQQSLAVFREAGDFIKAMGKTSEVANPISGALQVATHVRLLRNALPLAVESLRNQFDGKARESVADEGTSTRRDGLILRAVWQQLVRNGHTYREAFELVPDIIGGEIERAKDRVRKACEREDARVFAS